MTFDQIRRYALAWRAAEARRTGRPVEPVPAHLQDRADRADAALWQAHQQRQAAR